MAQFVVKKKQKLERVEIIPSDRAQDIRDLIYNPFTFDDDNLAIDEEPIEEDLTPPEPVEIEQTYYREFKFTNLRKPQNLDLRRVPPVAVLKELHDIEMEQSYKDGYNDCYNEMKPKFDAEKAELEDWIKNFDLVTYELNNQFSLDMKKFEDTLLSLSIIVAQHILEKEISAHSSIVIDQVRKAINAVEEDKIFKIRVNPTNISTLEKVKSSLFEDKSKLNGISIIADESVDLGGCMLETSAGIVDGRIKTQLGLVADQIFNSGIEDIFDEEEPLVDDYEAPDEVEEEKQEIGIEYSTEDEHNDETLLDFTENLPTEAEVIDNLETELSNIDNYLSDNNDNTSETSLEEFDFLKDLQDFDLGDIND